MIFYVLSVVILLIFLYLIYWIPKKLGYKKVGIILSSVVIGSLFVYSFMFIFGDILFSKSDANRILLEHGFKLEDEFEIISNRESGIGDYSQRFKLKISSEDKKRLEQIIMTSPNYQGYIIGDFNIKDDKPRYVSNDTVFIANYQDSVSYIYEFYKPNKKGIKPIWDKIYIFKFGNSLVYERVLD